MSAPGGDLEHLHQAALAIFSGALEDARIDAAFDRHMHFEGEVLVRTPLDILEPTRIDLAGYRRIFVVAIGKAAVPMLDILLARMKRRKGLRGVCSGAGLAARRNWRIRYFAGGHPLPNRESLEAARAALALLRKADEDTFVFFLVSGGGSAMLELPLSERISLEDTIAFHEALLASGAPIADVNVIRKHFSAVKGGRLAVAAGRAAKLSILLPDVPVSRLDALASSPTLPDRSTTAEALALIEKYGLGEKFPPAVRQFFAAGADQGRGTTGEEKIRPLLGRLRPAGPPLSAAPDRIGEVFARMQIDTLLSSHDLLNSARKRAAAMGFRVEIDNACDDWDYADAARYLLGRLRELGKRYDRLCLLSGGEVTVRIDRAPGAGGRNQQFALACALELAGWTEASAVTVLSAGSDGIDGNTRSAGAIADLTTAARARQFGFDPAGALRDFNACPLFTALGDTVVTGPTGHNLRDLRILLAVRGA